MFIEKVYTAHFRVLEATFFCCYKIHEGYCMLIFSTCHKTFHHRCPEPTATLLGVHININKCAAYTGKMTVTTCICPCMYLIQISVSFLSLLKRITAP